MEKPTKKRKPGKNKKEPPYRMKPDKKGKEPTYRMKLDKKEKAKKHEEIRTNNNGLSQLTTVTLVLFITAVIMVSMYVTVQKKDKDLKNAMDLMRSYFILSDPSFETKTDLEIIEFSQNLSYQLVSWTKRIEELQEEIDDIILLLEEWVIFRMNLYYFSDEEADWEHSKEKCEKKKSELISVHHGEEQAFIDQESARLGFGYWIGLYKNKSGHRGLSWINNEQVQRLYWNVEAQQPNGDGNCIYVVPKCKIKQCWHDDMCTKERRFICKRPIKPIDYFR